jgi:alkylresorcinol/alkylpyrone synthase
MLSSVSSAAAPAERTGAVPRLVSLGTALPPLRLTQQQALDFVLSRFPIGREATRALYRRVMAQPSIETRHFALDGIEDVLETDHDRINARFQKWAVRLSAQSLSRALRAAGLEPAAVDFAAVTTCTGYLCPGLSAYLVEAAGLRADVLTADVVGMGCGAAVPALRLAADFLRAHPGKTAAVVATEICSAAMYSADSPDLVVSNALFADGSAAALLTDAAPADDAGPGPVRPALLDFASLTLPEWREGLRFRTDGGYLRNVLSKDVPRQAAEALEKVTDDLLSRNGLSRKDVTRWVLHPGGDKVLAAVEERLGLSPRDLAAAHDVLRRCGNMSSPSCLFVLEESLAEGAAPGERGVLASFGAGFSAHAALLAF